uniref:YDG domain-containing protein n=1 Tax=Arcobacter sp. LA11 TaxID=1898176 RepID=UPI00215A00BB
GKYFDFLGADIQAGEWLIDPVNVTIDSTLASAIQTSLETGDVTISTDGNNTPDTAIGESGEDGNIYVESDITWSSDSDLTLSAYRDIYINASITSTNEVTSDGDPKAKLSLYYGQGAVSSNNEGNYYVNAPINLGQGSEFSTKQGSDGAVIDWTVITELGNEGSITGRDLQGMNGDLTKNYVLGANIDASETSTWDSEKGFDSIGDYNSRFTGNFDGLGHAINWLSINRPSTDYIGLFGYTSGSSLLKNVVVINATITAKNSVGGLVGSTFAGTISNSIFAGTVNGNDSVGGLVGSNQGTISNSYSTGTVSGSMDVGGLVGHSSRDISNSYSTATVNGNDSVGGLVGSTFAGTIINSYSTATVNGTSQVGGLVGVASDDPMTGGTVIEKSYSTGAVSGTSDVGGLIGVHNEAVVTNSYWDTQTSGQVSSAGGEGKTTQEMQTASTFTGWGITADGAYPTLVREDGVTSWRIVLPGTPVIYTLSDILTGYTYSGSQISLNSLWNTASIFDGTDYDDWIYGTDYSFMYDGNTITSFVDAGYYTNISIKILADGFIRDSASTNGNFTIDPKELSVSGITAKDKVYDGTTVASLKTDTATLVGIVNGDTVTTDFNHVTTSFEDKNVAEDKTVNISNLSLGGEDAGNYTLTETTATTTASITQKEVMVDTLHAENKVYDGLTTVNIDTSSATIIGQILGDILLVSGADGNFSDKNVGDTKDVTLSRIYFDGADAGNYILKENSVTGLTADITPKSVTLNYTADNKIYDGTTDVIVSKEEGAFIENDSVDVTQEASFADKNAGATKTVNITNIALSGADANNYSLIETTAMTNADIMKKELSVNGVTAKDKVYDGTTVASLTTDTATLVGVVNGDTVSEDFSSLTGNFEDKNVGTDKTISISGVKLTGADKDNYEVSSSDATANISKKELELSNFQAEDKIYDGTRNAVVSADGLNESDIVAQDDVSLDMELLEGLFENAQEGKEKNVFLKDRIQLSGVDAQNYKLVGKTTATISNELQEVITAIVNEQEVDVKLPQTVVNLGGKTPKLEIVKPKTPQMEQTTTTLAKNIGVQNSNINIVSKTNSGENANTIVTLAEIKKAINEQPSSNTQANQEVRVPLSKNSIVDLVNGGVNLPNGVEQQFFVVADEN